MRQAQSNYLRLNFVAQKGIEVATFICNFTSSSFGHYYCTFSQSNFSEVNLSTSNQNKLTFS